MKTSAKKDSKQAVTQADLRVAEELQKVLTPLQQKLVVNVAENFAYGSHWAVFAEPSRQQVGSYKTYVENRDFYSQYLKDETVQIVRGIGGFIVVTNFTDLLTFTSNVLGQQDALAIYNQAVAAHDATTKRCIKDMQACLAGKKDLPVVGLYSVNTTDVITVGDKKYSAYRLTIEEFTRILNQLGISASPKDIHSTLTISPTGTGAFVNLKRIVT